MTTDADAKRFEALSGNRDGKIGFKRIESFEVPSASGTTQKWYLLVRPPKSMYDDKSLQGAAAESMAMCVGSRKAEKESEDQRLSNSGATLFERTHSQQHTAAIGLEHDEEQEEGEHDMILDDVTFSWVDPHGEKFSWKTEDRGLRGGITDKDASRNFIGEKKGGFTTF